MLLPDVAASNITILSIFKIILFEFDYRNVNVFTSSKSNYDVALEMMNILKSHSKPANILNLDGILSDRIPCGEPVLNVLFVSDNTTELAEGLKQNIYPNDISLIVDLSIESTHINFNMHDGMEVSNKVLIITNMSVLALNPFRHHQMDILPLNPFHRSQAKTFIKSYISSSKYLRQEKNLTIFFEYLSPRSMIAFLETGFFYIGSDGSITEILLKMLNATGTFVSDVGLRYPMMVRTWNELWKVGEGAYSYYQNAITNNELTDFYRR